MRPVSFSIHLNQKQTLGRQYKVYQIFIPVDRQFFKYDHCLNVLSYLLCSFTHITFTIKYSEIDDLIS